MIRAMFTRIRSLPGRERFIFVPSECNALRMQSMIEGIGYESVALSAMVVHRLTHSDIACILRVGLYLNLFL